MRVLIISDIHANLAALESVLDDAGEYDAAWCLGDLTGYGPNPNECVSLVRSLPGLICLVGNHDKAVLGEIDLHVFNGDARAAIEWTQSTVTPDTMAYLAALPADERYEDYTLAHGSPRQPVWEYILDRYVAQENFPLIATPYCLVGHTHQPVVFHELHNSLDVEEEEADYSAPRALDNERLILNPGSVGQPRDNNPEAAYALLDTDTAVWEYRRAPYDIAETQHRIRAAQLPERLAARLAYGW
jgi:diadenosine tetraphosphatase ApaH/serine/threonine PP2A family protein phosphatase